MDKNEEIISNIEDSNQFYSYYDSNVKNNKSSNILSKYEKTMVIFERAQLISNGSKPYISNPGKYNSINEIVEEELMHKPTKIPFIIKRTIGNTQEYWKLSDLIII